MSYLLICLVVFFCSDFHLFPTNEYPSSSTNCALFAEGATTKKSSSKPKDVNKNSNPIANVQQTKDDTSKKRPKNKNERAGTHNSKTTTTKYHKLITSIEQVEYRALSKLYESTNGDQWKQSDLWLSPPGTLPKDTEGAKSSSDSNSSIDKKKNRKNTDMSGNKNQVHVCDWYGITCEIITLMGDINLFYDYPATLGGLAKESTAVDAEAYDEYYFYSQDVDRQLDADDYDVSDEEADTNSNAANEEVKKTNKLRIQFRVVTEINLSFNNLNGTLPQNFGCQLAHLKSVDLSRNELQGTIPNDLYVTLPTTATKISTSKNIYEKVLSQLHSFNRQIMNQLALIENDKSSTSSSSSHSSDSDTDDQSNQNNNDDDNNSNDDDSNNRNNGGNKDAVSTLQQLWIEKDDFISSVNDNMTQNRGFVSTLRYLNITENHLTGSIPSTLGDYNPLLEHFDISHNMLTGKLPRSLTELSQLRTFHGGYNQFSDELPNSDNAVNQPQHTMLYWMLLEVFDVTSAGSLNGTIPEGFGYLPQLKSLHLADNLFTGTIPQNLAHDSSSSQSHSNNLRELSLVPNRLTGTIPKDLCRQIEVHDFRLLPYPCDAIACAVGTFHPGGKASELGTCMECPPPAHSVRESPDYDRTDSGGNDGEDDDDDSNSRGNNCAATREGDEECEIKEEKYLGATTCSTRRFLRGDFDKDAILTQRETLWLLYATTNGRRWGRAGNEQSKWADWSYKPNAHECDFHGVGCTNGVVTSLDLRNADLCAPNLVDGNGDVAKDSKGAGNNDSNESNDKTDNKPKSGSELPQGSSVVPANECLGIPSELSYLSKGLQFLDLSRSPHLKGTLPSELGMLHKLEVLDVSRCSLITGTIPSELSNLMSLQKIDLSENSLSGTINPRLFQLHSVEYINFHSNYLTGTIPHTNRLQNLKVLILSRQHTPGFTGPIPNSITEVRLLENLELYGNSLVGTIPESIGNCTSLRRIDLYSNFLTGTIPARLGHIGALSIIHLKRNRLTGTIPNSISSLPTLTWLDLGWNQLSGEIPHVLGSTPLPKEVHLSNNRLRGTVPESLCNNQLINGGAPKRFGCHGILCPLWFYNEENGYASERGACIECPEHQRANPYLGSIGCQSFAQRDVLHLFYGVMKGEQAWPLDSRWNFNAQNNEGELINECGFEGVSCDDDGVIDELTLPLSSAILAQNIL
eukprot:CAMPEP_0194374642 /NCGR_PEP_ID=MMETSP0174-20130528/23079_1 /TAXON_ID=216777 /ORGANISM="Proboscia alata, Strain PI-D3" /LENGTH=1196 /DNA_ID=CAMNT_0039154341 /DNA_START=121 /DNA_END=3711 /DNA_ORIENTATION=+